jgi:hypothetical protein
MLATRAGDVAAARAREEDAFAAVLSSAATVAALDEFGR